MKKILLTSILLGTMVLSSVGASAVETVSSDMTGWNYKASTQSWEYYIKGVKPVNGVIQQGNKLYYFDSLGNLQNGWFYKNNSTVYFKDGVITTGWKQIDGIWYYFGSFGEMVTGPQVINNKNYEFDSNGHLI